MVQRRDLNTPPGQKLADVVKALREKAESSKTGAHGVKHMGVDGDVTWPGTDEQGAPVTKSVKRFSVELDDTTARAEQLAQDIADAEADIAEAAGRLEATRQDLVSLGTRVTETAAEAAKRASAGPIPPRGAPVGAHWISPEGYLYVAIPAEEVPV